MELTFTNPIYLFALLSIPFIILGHFVKFKKTKKKHKIPFTIVKLGKGKKRSKKIALLVTRSLILFFLITGISGPTFSYYGNASESDFMLAIDTSASMLAEDLTPNRLEAAKSSAISFVKSLPIHSNIGLISFSTAPKIEEKLGTNHKEIIEKIKSIEVSKLGGTNLGDTLIEASNNLDGEIKTIIILTDGQSNIGTSINKAIDYLKENNVKANTIGIATEKGGKFMDLEVALKLNEEELITIAKATGGIYSKATNHEELQKIFKNMASPKKKKIPLNLSRYFIVASLALLFAEWTIIFILKKILL